MSKRRRKRKNMKTLFKDLFLFSGFALYNNTERNKLFKFYNGDTCICQYVVLPKGGLIDPENPYGVVRFIPNGFIIDKGLFLDAGRKWAVIINKNDSEYFSITSYRQMTQSI